MNAALLKTSKRRRKWYCGVHIGGLFDPPTACGKPAIVKVRLLAHKCEPLQDVVVGMCKKHFEEYV